MKWLKSRQMWTLILTFIFNGWAAVSGSVDPVTATYINGIMMVLAAYFRIDARV